MNRKRNTYVINGNMDPARLVREIKDLSQEDAERIIGIIEERIQPWNIAGFEEWKRGCYGKPKKLDRKLWAIDTLLKTHGTEIIVAGGHTSPQRTDGSDIVLEYCNTGDTYAATVAYEHKNCRFVLTSWGDWVERHPRLTEDNTNSVDY